jgi:hypothetical protein
VKCTSQDSRWIDPLRVGCRASVVVQFN